MSWLPIGGAARRAEGAALRYIGHCSMAVGMPYLAALEMASHWILASLRSSKSSSLALIAFGTSPEEGSKSLRC